MRKTTWGIAISLVLAAACGKKVDKPEKLGEQAKPTEPTAKAGVPNDEAMAFALGNKMGMIDAFMLMKTPDKAADDLDKARTLASALGLDPPHLPGPDEDEDAAIAKALGAKKSADVQQSFILGNRLRVAWFGVELGADPSGPLRDVETSAKKLGIPESEWRAAYDQIKAKPDADALDKLEDGLQTYIERGAK